MEQNLTQEELDERIAILRQFRTLLEKQRNKFREYLTILEKQETSISQDEAESIASQTELEHQVLSSLSNLQKVVLPMEALYKETHQQDKEIPQLKADLQRLQDDVLAQNQRNRELLKSRITQVRTQLQRIRDPRLNPYANSRSIYSSSSRSASIIDVEM